jgi:hypothetical protein
VPEASGPPPSAQNEEPSPSVKPKKLLRDAADECIKHHVSKRAWFPDSVEQVRTAIRLFDFACGGDVAIDDLEQGHVTRLPSAL